MRSQAVGASRTTIAECDADVWEEGNFGGCARPGGAVADEGEDAPIWQPTAARARKSVEQLLLERGQITEDHLLQAKNVQGQTPGKSVAQILLTMNAASEAQILSGAGGDGECGV